MILLSLILSPGAALAHRPHPPMTTLALAPDFEESGRAWSSLDRYGFTPLLYSDDHGRHWTYYAGEPMAEYLMDGAYTDGGVLVLAGREGGIWTSADEGGSWSVDNRLKDMGVSPVDITTLGERVMVAGDGGLYALDLDGELSQVWPLPTQRVVEARPEDGSLLLSAATAGLVLASLDGGDSFEALPELPDAQFPWALAAAGGEIFVGADQGLIYALDVETWRAGEQAGWRACAPLAFDPEKTYADRITRLVALEDGRLIATTGVDSVHESDAACESWGYNDTGLLVFYGAAGGAVSTDEGISELEWRGPYGLVAGYNGVSLTTNDGATWRLPKMVPSDFDRGIAITSTFPANRTIWQATYGGGVTWTHDGGESWGGSSVGLVGHNGDGWAIYSFGMSASANQSASDTLYYSGAYTPFRSLDGGESWEIIEALDFNTKSFSTQGDRVYALERSENSEVDRRGAAISMDDGETWELVDGFGEDSAVKSVIRLRHTCLGGREATLAISSSPPGMLVRYEGEQQWIPLLRVEEGDSYHMDGGVWPPETCDRLLFATGDDTVTLSDDGGQTWRAASQPPTDGMNMLTQADDGTYFMATRTGWVFRSRDGGDTWERMSNRTAPLALSMTTSRRFDETGLIVMGTHSGVWWAQDGEDIWRPLPRYERFEDSSIHLICVPGRATRDAFTQDCELYKDDTHGNGGGYVMYHGDLLNFTFEGDAFRVIGLQRPGGEIAVTVDGDWVETWGDDDELALSGLTPGWHDVELYVASESEFGPLLVDLVETFGPGEPITDWPELQSADVLLAPACGCRREHDSGAALLMPLLALLGWRRRRC